MPTGALSEHSEVSEKTAKVSSFRLRSASFVEMQLKAGDMSRYYLPVREFLAQPMHPLSKASYRCTSLEVDRACYPSATKAGKGCHVLLTSVLIRRT